MKLRSLIAVLAVFGLVAGACSSNPADLSTTSSLITDTTMPIDPMTTTTTTEPDSTPTTLRGEIVSEFEVVVRVPSDNGDILYVLIPQGAYTDVDLENFIQDLRDTNDQLWGVEVFDNSAAVMAFQVAEDARTEDDQALLAEHHLVSLVNGDTIRFQGPFSEFGEYILAS